jgi:hypothetical protein
MNPLLILLAVTALIVIAKIFHFVPFGLALTSDADTPSREGKKFNYQVYQAMKIYAGALVMLNATGFAVKGATATGQKAVGRGCYQVDNSSGASGALSIEVEEGVFQYKNSAAGDLITIADIGNTCYIVDDETVAKTSGPGTRSPAGYIRDVDSDGVWVEIKNTYATDGDLVASNNLSDVGLAATARANIAANKIVLDLLVADLTSASGLIYYKVSPVAGTIKKIYSVINGALTVGDATLTGKIGATAITNGVITITQAGSAAGDVDVATPTALNVVAIEDYISITVGGTNTAAKTAQISIYIET